MSDGLMDLESEPTPQAQAPTAPQAPPVPEQQPLPGVPVPPEPPPDPDEEQAVDLQGAKMVPLPALKAVREELKQTKQIAQAVPQLQQQVAQLTGQLQTFQSLQQALQPQAPTQTNTSPDPEDVELARSLGYFNTDGSVNVEAVKPVKGFIEKKAQQIAQSAMKPMQQNIAKQQSESNYQTIVNYAVQNGIQVDQNALRQQWDALPVHITADGQAAITVLSAALGAQQLTRGRQPQPTGRPPVHTENIGNAPPRSQRVVSDVERSIVGGRMDDKKYLDLTKDHKPGRSNVLEE